MRVPSLSEGSIIDVIAPASACSREELEGGAAYLESLGFVPRVPKTIFGRTKIVANTDDQRFSQLKAALTATDSQAVWCVRGGYGAIRLLPQLARVRKPAFKWFLGYSDITTLHWFFNSAWNWPTLHSPLLDRFGRGAAQAIEKKELSAWLAGTAFTLEHTIKPVNEAALKTNVFESKIVGGNLATLQSSFGTPWAFRGAGRIVFFEDIGERPHRVDRMLHQAEQAGAFDRAHAIIFGDMVLANEEDKKLLWSHVIEPFAKRSSIPIFRGLRSGHGPLQRTVPFNWPVRLTSGKKSSLTWKVR